MYLLVYSAVYLLFYVRTWCVCTFVFVFVCVCACVFIHACAHLTHSSHYVYVVSTLEHQRLRVFVHARVQLTFPDMHALFYSVTSETLCVRSFMHTDNLQLWYTCALFLLCNSRDSVCMLVHARAQLTNSSQYTCVVFTLEHQRLYDSVWQHLLCRLWLC